MSTVSLEELYNSPTPSASVAAAEQPAPPDTEPPAPAPVTEATGTGDKSTAAPPATEEELPADVIGLRAAVKAERQKRQERDEQFSKAELRASEAERKATEMEQIMRRLAAPQQQQPQQQQHVQRHAPPNPLTDPEEAYAYQQQQFSEALAERDNAIYETRVLLSQETWRARHADYDEIEEVFANAANRDASLAQALRGHPLPAKFAYETGKRLKMMQDMGSDPDAYIKRKVTEALAKQAEEAPAQPHTAPVVPTPTVPTQRPAPPQSLAGVPSVARRAAPSFNGITPLEDLYK